MEQLLLADMDYHRGDVRVLYQSVPSLPQATRPGWTVNVYVALLKADGTVENRLLVSGQRNFASLLLRRGADESYLLPKPGSPGDAMALERRSLADGALLDTLSDPLIARAAAESQSLHPAADGGFFHVAQSEDDAGATGLSWKHFSPSGSVLYEGAWMRRSAMARLSGVFPAGPGSLGMTVHLTPRGQDHLPTDIPSPVVAELGGRRLEAWTFSETRALATGQRGQVAWVSPAIERDLAWKGEMSIPASLPVDQMMAQNARQMALMERTALAQAGQRQIGHLAYRGFDELKAAPDGWGLLVRQTADRDLEPPLHGVWYLLLGSDGKIDRRVRLESEAERLNARFERFLPTPDGGLLVAGRRDRGRRFHVTALDSDGAATWSVTDDHPDVTFDDIAGDPFSPWLIGHGWSEASAGTVLWVQRVAREAARATAAAPNAAAEARAARDTTAAELEPISGCRCDCDEFAHFKAVMASARNLPRAEQMALMSKPQFRARMECMGSCTVQYAECGR